MCVSQGSHQLRAKLQELFFLTMQSRPGEYHRHLASSLPDCLYNKHSDWLAVNRTTNTVACKGQTEQPFGQMIYILSL